MKKESTISNVLKGKQAKNLDLLVINKMQTI